MCKLRSPFSFVRGGVFIDVLGLDYLGRSNTHSVNGGQLVPYCLGRLRPTSDSDFSQPKEHFPCFLYLSERKGLGAR